jgi:alpha-tubulin suppressor-like RCC1 family protein
VQVSGPSSEANAIVAGFSHACAITTGGSVKCWGCHQAGELGIGGRNYWLPGDLLDFSNVIFYSGFLTSP